MSALKETIHITRDEYLKLVSAQVVLNCLKNSMNKYRELVANSVECCQPSDEKNFVEKRKFFNVKRWNCISRPQYKYSCGISSLVSVWNYLFSTLGTGSLKPISQEEAMNILGYEEPFDGIRFGPFTGNATLMRWFKKLNAHFSVEGKASMFYKPVGTCKTVGVNGNVAKENLESLLHFDDFAFIYHCYNHYCCPIGYEREPINQKKIFQNDPKNDDEYIDLILVADTSKKYESIHCVKWDDIEKDLNLKSPEYFNIRHPELGIQLKKLKNKELLNSTNERNLHCIIQFKRFDTSNSMATSDSFSKLSRLDSNETDEFDENEFEN